MRNPLTGNDVVTLFAAYCKFFWLIADISLKTLDRLIIEESCAAARCTIKQFRECIENINTEQSAFRNFDWTQYVKVDVDNYLSYLQTVPEILVDKSTLKSRGTIKLKLRLVTSTKTTYYWTVYLLF